MSSTISVCPNCRNTCAKCHKPTDSSHPVWVCSDCKRKYDGKCSVCGAKKLDQVLLEQEKFATDALRRILAPFAESIIK